MVRIQKLYVEQVTNLLVCHTALGEEPVLIIYLILSPVSRLVLQVPIKALYDVSSTVCRSFCQICSFEVIYLHFDSGLDWDETPRRIEG